MHATRFRRVTDQLGVAVVGGFDPETCVSFSLRLQAVCSFLPTNCWLVPNKRKVSHVSQTAWSVLLARGFARRYGPCLYKATGGGRGRARMVPEGVNAEADQLCMQSLRSVGPQ